MTLFRKGLSPFQTALAMIGAKPGDEVLVIGADNGALAAELALVTGLNGRLLVVDRTEGAKARVAAAADRAGALVEFEDAPTTMLPLDPDRFRIAVINRHLAALDAESRADCCAEAFRVIRPGGRLIVIEGAGRPGAFGMLPTRSTVIPAAEIEALLRTAGARAVRRLAAAEGVAYFEAFKAGT
jgi:ubiquinone/menaquinone biosynthesis C-methylase UbiE